MASPKNLDVRGTTAARHRDATHDPHFIVDGPSLAYHIYYRLLAHKPRTLNVFDATPSYEQIGEGFLAFLEELQAHGARIDVLFFDGYLPHRKDTIRHSRLDQSLKNLNLFYATNITDFAPSQLSAISEPPYQHQLFRSAKKVAPSFRGLPPPTFLVPAVLDALRSSKYAPSTNLVPGEADIYCARAAQKDGGIILTSDSDMLVYDLGPSGAVAFLLDVKLTGEEPVGRQVAGCEILKATIWCPKVIAERLGLPDLQRLAFMISQDPHMTMVKAVQRARKSAEAVEGFKVFVEEYDIGSSIPNHSTQCRDNLDSVTVRCQHFDPRIAELCFQIASLPSKVGNPCMYLPFMTEDPSRSTAWAPSLQTRALAYAYLVASIKEHPTPHTFAVNEYTRKGSRFVPEELHLTTSTEDLEKQAQELAANFLGITELLNRGTSPASSKIKYRLFALSEIHLWHLRSHKKPPSRTSMIRVFSCSRDTHWTWEDVHLFAQVQGFLYSLRILRQVLQYLFHGNEETMPSGVKLAYEICIGLPGFEEMMGPMEKTADDDTKSNVEDVINRLMKVLQSGVITGDSRRIVPAEDGKRDAEGPVKGKRRRRRGKSKDVAKPKKSEDIKNMYDLLKQSDSE